MAGLDEGDTPTGADTGRSGAAGDGFEGEGAAGAVTRRADGEGEGGAAVGVALAGAGRPVVVLAVGHDLLHGVQILAHRAADRHAQPRGGLESAAEFGEELALKIGSEGAELDLAEAVALGVPLAVVAADHVAQADAGAGVVEAHAARRLPHP